MAVTSIYYALQVEFYAAVPKVGPNISHSNVVFSPKEHLIELSCRWVDIYSCILNEPFLVGQIGTASVQVLLKIPSCSGSNKYKSKINTF